MPIIPIVQPDTVPWVEVALVAFDLGGHPLPARRTRVPPGAPASRRRQEAALHLESLPQVAIWAWSDGSATGGGGDGGTDA